MKLSKYMCITRLSEFFKHERRQCRAAHGQGGNYCDWHAKELEIERLKGQGLTPNLEPDFRPYYEEE
jgi:hypothetical protein